MLDRSALADSPLADLHAIAGELGIDGFRRLRKPDLIDAIVARQGGNGGAPADAPEAAEDEGGRSRRRRGGRGGRGRDRDRDRDDAAEEPTEERGPRGGRDRDREERNGRDREERGGREERNGRDERGGRDSRDRKPEAGGAGKPREGELVEGVVELLGNGSGFVRVNGPEASDGDVYISAAQVRRCELVAGDKVAGPVRAPRRSERYPSLVRIDTINGKAADEAGTDGVKFDELPAAFANERFAFGSEDPTVKAIEWLTPFGRGSRVVIVGGPRAGKTEALRRLAGELAKLDGVEVSVALVGARPEEISEWKQGKAEVAADLSFAASPDAQSQALERAIDNGKRIAARGGDAVVLVDTLDGVHPAAARKALAAARNIVDGGSLTVVATGEIPFGGETTTIALDAEIAGTGRYPALDLLESGTLRPELLIGAAGAAAIAAARDAAR
ncbi:Rho termination factor N-terminal domain-containing protein [Conexibacter sp. JD483]|uniref:Rho termination factor N-terminal domain-containing protein n=1 Tax=unclassified Conexibacter TaxID=2627773 RepID=UPI002721CF43|nr:MULTISPECIES: Rho termination factor N-terminal domain-containing protein [unclassified Conexibacter]MDO8184702.1 Rho termination factor N-terminal domain-containing protein [Conexibacter sp. CPCC 205706]MDO8198008.1 Rho termination factor N-terminal domain-containing protein [Conexibacter sp. CPCC 205762]MDR9368438.1 Rho termination factor N-terminal domain-containing protein [Conexibacter sp. JD483]